MLSTQRACLRDRTAVPGLNLFTIQRLSGCPDLETRAAADLYLAVENNNPELTVWIEVNAFVD